MRVVVLCLFVCLLSVFPAFAIPVTFDFSDSPSDYYFPKADLTLNVSAGLATVTDTSRGLGVDAGGSDSGTLDGDGAFEALWFSFSEKVRLVDASFYWVDVGDAFAFSLGDGDQFGEVEDILRIGDKDGFFDFTAHNLSSQMFGIKASEGSSFRVTTLTVDFTPVPTPEPSTYLLFGSGVAGLFFWRRCHSG
ncbi:PEP-CTERM protein-sorting domain-containing protein [Malonomonas rubra DSM 5091]|uniref:PEP-CTERM protein-sorting domain-containing protein n=1 Tax=Malonomonas rubra DSM 5091 TaxID=1122189 RepID=A0A1M6LQ33_MALRU|nr:PEP-CTERM sorting domain-containing protein [Malonomonas rubra]SHJ73304.1 PEP-CTERM protein-sorting domain-containing protein [Malonomonas rubra DSM 5091]